MEVAGLVLTAVAFVDQAIKSGTILAKLTREYPEAGKQITDAAIRLEAQKYTLNIWHPTWKRKAELQQPAALADKFRALWGEDGYDLILKCLTQLNARFGEAFRTLRSIDPSSFQEPLPGSESRPNSMLLPNSSVPTPDSSLPSLVLSQDDENHSESQKSKKSSSRASRFFSKKSKSVDLKFWKRPSKNAPDTPTSLEENQKQEQEVREQRLSPGTKFKWSLGLKDDLRLLITEIDDWLAQLQTLSVRCEEEQKLSKAVRAVTASKNIRTAAKDLYAALLKTPSPNALQFRLERERIDSKYFDNLLGPVAYVDRSNSSLKFPLLISNEKSGPDAFLLVAEAILPGPTTHSVTQNDQVKTLEEIMAALKQTSIRAKESNSVPSPLSPTPMVLQSSQTTIILHNVPGIISHDQSSGIPVPRCTFLELLKAETAVDPFIARWKRVQLAFVIALSVLHLYETGWLSEQLETGDFQFFGTAQSQYVDFSPIAPYVSPTGPKDPSQSPFDCLKVVGDPQTFLGARDNRLATLFYRLGIVLFELGRGIEHNAIESLVSQNYEMLGLAPEDLDMIRKSRVLKEIEKIPFGRTYADLVKVCLTGRLYATAKMNVDGAFNDAVVEKLRKLETHFKAIFEDTGLDGWASTLEST